MPDAGDNCKSAEEGSACYKSVAWLRQEGFSNHPEWYQGYSSESTFEEVQDMLYGLGKANCPKPCLGPSPVALFKNEPKVNCRDTIKGDACYTSVTFLREVGLELHPDWFPDLRADSSTSTIQAELHRRGKADCPLPCALTDEDKRSALHEMKEAAGMAEEQKDCQDAEPGTKCYNDVTYGMAEGIKNYPWMYEGLTESSTFKQVQEQMYLHRRSFCGRPCPEKQVDLDLLAKHPEELIEKKRVQDMSMKELNDYFNGDWDGYVARDFHAQDYQVVEYKKSRYGASTTIKPEEAMALPIVDNITEIEAVANASDVDSEMANASTQDSELNFTEDVAPPQVDSDPVSEPASNVTEETAPAAAENSTEAAEANSMEATEANSTEAAAEEEASVPKEEAIQETYQVLTVRNCLKKLYQVTPENFGDLRRECEDVMEEAYDGGEEHEALSKEAMSYFVWAQRRVEQIKDERRANETQAAESTHEADVVDEPTPSIESPEAHAAESAQQADIVDEPTPSIDSEGQQEETHEEMEQRIRKELLDEMQQTTTVAVQKETEEEMRQRIKAELMRELMIKEMRQKM
jgi:hypothetical protein